MYNENVDCWIKPFKTRKIQSFDLNQRAGLKEFRDKRFGFEYLFSFVSEDSDTLGIFRESKDFSSEIEKVDANKKEH